MTQTSISLRPFLAALGAAALIFGCSSGETSAESGSASGSGGGSGAENAGSGGTTADSSAGGGAENRAGSGGSADQASGGAGGAHAAGGSDAGGASGSGGASHIGARPCTTSDSVCPAKGTPASYNCQMGAICCAGTSELTCFCAAETCTFYFGS